MARHSSDGIGGLLTDVAADVAEIGPKTWQLTLMNGSTLPVRATLSNGWLALATSAPLRSQSDLDWLAVNGHLPGSVRAARALTCNITRLHTDVPIAGDTDLRLTVQRACIDLLHASERVEDHRPDVFGGPSPLVDSFQIDEIELACDEVAWPRRRRADGALVLDVASPAGLRPARLWGSVAGPDRLVVELGALPAVEVCRQASARLLLVLGTAVRLTRGFTIERDGSLIAAISVPVTDAHVDAVELAGGALAAACGIAAQEFDALADEQLARRYLDLTAVPLHSELDQEDTCQPQL